MMPWQDLKLDSNSPITEDILEQNHRYPSRNLRPQHSIHVILVKLGNGKVIK